MKPLNFAIITIALILTGECLRAQYNSNPRIGDVSFEHLKDMGLVNVSYMFFNTAPSEKYLVWIEAFENENNKKIEAKTFWGDVGVVVVGNAVHKAVWAIKTDGVALDKEIYFKVHAVKQPDIKIGSAMLASTFFPGAGRGFVSGKNKPLLGIAGYGFIGGAIGLNLEGYNNYQSYLKSTGTEGDKFLANARNMKKASFVCAGIGAAMWAINYYDILKQAKKSKNITPEETIYNPKFISLSPEISKAKFLSTKGLPPNLYAELNFYDDNGNGILEAQEKGMLTVIVTNKGKGDALKLNVVVSDSTYDSELKIGKVETINLIKPGESKVIKVPISASVGIKTAKHKFEILIKESYGFDVEPIYLRMPTYAYQPPKFNISGYDIIDFGDGTGAVEEDGQLQLGEQVKVKMTIQNIGQSAAKNTTYKIVSEDIQNVYIVQNEVGKIGTLESGQTAIFEFTISVNKRVKPVNNKLPVKLILTEDVGRANLNIQLPILINQKPPKKVVVNVKADIESLRKESAVFIVNSKKIQANIGNIIDIKTVNRSISVRKNAIAVVLGISKYENMAPAPYADNDATIMAQYFEKVLGITPENIYVYQNEKANSAKFKKLFSTSDAGELKKGILKDDTEIFVFYSGHGVPDKSGENVYLFPYDGEKDALDEFAYNLNTFYENLNALHAKHVTIFIDACFSGFSKSSASLSSKNLVAQKGVKIKPKQMWQGNSNFTVFTSSTAEETSLGLDATETGLFTYYLCAGMQGKADSNNDKKITNGELKDYVIENVKTTSVKISGLQTPEFYGNEDDVLIEY